MDTLSAFAMGQANRDNELMVFDWVKAATIIKKRKVTKASAGLEGDWEYTGGIILEYGKVPKDSYTYLASTWATPQLSIEGAVIDCYIMASKRPKWNAKTFWPKEALKILKGE